MAIVQAAGTGKEIKVTVAVLIGEPGAFGFFKRNGEGACIALNFRFKAIKYSHGSLFQIGKSQVHLSCQTLRRTGCSQ